MARRHRPARRPHRGRGGSSSDRYIQEAEQEAKVQFGPQSQALRELLIEAKGTLQTRVRAEQGAMEGIQAAVDAALPQIKSVYQQAGVSQEQAHAQVQADLAKLGAAADPYKATTSRDVAGARVRLSTAMSSAINDLGRRKVEAAQGRAYSTRAALQEFGTTAEKIYRQKQALAGQRGAFTASTASKLRSADAASRLAERRVRAQEQGVKLRAGSLALQERKTLAQITGKDPVTGKPYAGGKKAGKDKFKAGQLGAHRKVVTGVQDAAATVKRLRGMGLNFPEIGAALTAPKTSGGKRPNPYGGYSPLSARAGVELVRDRHLSGPTFHSLRQRGLIGHRTPHNWRPPRLPHFNTL